MKEASPRGEWWAKIMVSWSWTCIALLATAPLIVTTADDMKGPCGRLRSRPWPSLHTEIRGWEDGGGLLRLRGGRTEAGRTWSSRGRWGQKKDMEAAGGGDPATHYEGVDCADLVEAKDPGSLLTATAARRLNPQRLAFAHKHLKTLVGSGAERPDDVLTELSMQALGMLSGLSIEHVMAMLDAYQACDWMPGEPLKSQLMRILEKAEQVSKIAESSSLEELASAVEGCKGAGKEEVLAAHSRIKELLQQGVSAEGVPAAFGALEGATLECVGQLDIEGAMTLMSAYTAADWKPEGDLMRSLEAKLQQLDGQLEAMQDEEALETHAPMEDDDNAGEAELEMMREADYVVRPGAWYLHRRMGNAKDLIWKLIPGADPSRKNLTAVLSSLPPSRPQSIFLARGPHNASDADGDLEISQELHFTGSPRGSTWIGWAEKIDIRGDLPHPERGFGRIRVWPGGTGTTFRNVRWESENLHCLIAEGSAVMFEGCELRCEALHYCSAIWGFDGAFIAMKSCTVGGFDKKRQGTNGIVLDASTALIDACRIELFDGSACVVAFNSTLRMQNSSVVDCHSVIAACDGVLHEGPETEVPGTIELVGNTFQCFQGWEDEDRTVNFVTVDNKVLDMQFPELERELAVFEDPVARTEWDEDEQRFVHCGMTRKELADEAAFFESMRRPEAANLPEINKKIRREFRRPWESSTSSEEKDEFEIGREVGTGAAERFGREPKSIVRPKMPRNRHHHGVTKGPRVLKNRRNEYT